MPDSLAPLLKQYFGYDAFRPLQREIMGASMAGRDAVAILPTGAGKSLCFQLPALARDGVTLVISPLIALMKDQVDALTASGVLATFLNSSIQGSEAQRRRSGLEQGHYKLLYAAPERVMMEGFIQDLQRWSATEPSRAARLACRRFHGACLEHQAPAQTHRDEQNLPAV